MDFLERLESEEEAFRRNAWAAGISRPAGSIKASVALPFAKKLIDCQSFELAKMRMFEDPAGAQAFWIYSEAALASVRAGDIATGATPAREPAPSFCIELLASLVYRYCDYLEAKYQGHFAFVVN